MPHLIVFSHLRWNFVYQRPQQLMSRLSRHYPVLFIEEPVLDEAGPARLECTQRSARLEVLVPHTPVPAAGFHDDQLPLLQALLEQALADRQIDDRLVWLYTPMALPLATALRPRALVYDCMDELSAFKGAPRQLGQREHQLMRSADLVLTGGPALYEARRGLNDQLHCLPSAVDAEHFAPARLQPGSAPAQAVAALQGGLTGPRLGFFGVIDERMDLRLLGTLAALRPDWQFVMVGPVVKIDPEQLPRPANIHWLGLQSYERLPYFLAGWDVALMPFAINDATRFISPTKTLEYMAGEKPIVSTPVTDVLRLYGSVVRIAADAWSFAQACTEALAEASPAQRPARARRQRDMAETVASFSWDRSAQTVHRLIGEVLADQPARVELPAVAFPALPGTAEALLRRVS